MTASTTPTRPRTVTFSQVSQLSFFPKDEKYSNWYSKQEQLYLRGELVQDARRISKAIDSGKIQNAEELYECLGIEIFLTKGLARHVKEMRNEHVDAVLSEQSLQKQRDACDPEKLSNVSKTTSHWGKKRAQQLAQGYSVLA